MSIKKHREHARPEINMTSMIDVVSTLLVVFMMTAPMMSSGVNVDLPKGSHSSLKSEDKSVNISVDRKGNIFVGTRSVSVAQLRKQMSALRAQNQAATIIISGDTQSRYGRVIEIMSELKSLGFAQVGLRTTPAIGAPETPNGAKK
ncbi:MAG: biopolymer transporter ExbD [Rickettsiales bacterium]|jgi:biopolymer transport protein TolR|nr:biopolymer transporter ExbD [Rickettsiales bacterium]